MQLVLLYHMQLQRQAHPYPVSEGPFKTKNAAAAVLPVKYNDLDILYISVGNSKKK